MDFETVGGYAALGGHTNSTLYAPQSGCGGFDFKSNTRNQMAAASGSDSGPLNDLIGTKYFQFLKRADDKNSCVCIFLK